MSVLLLVALLSQDKDLFPAKNGTKWVYDSAGQDLTVTVDGTAKVGDKECVVFKKEWTGGSSKEFYAVTEKGAFLHRLEADRTSEFLDNPVPRLQFGTKKGDSWTWKTDGQEGKYENTGEEEVEVPAGKYKALKIVVTAQAGEMKYVVTRWFAPGVGLVKEEMIRDNQTRTTALKKFEAPK